VLRRLQALLVFGVSVVALPATAQESADEPTSADEQQDPADAEVAAAEEPAEESTPTDGPSDAAAGADAEDTASVAVAADASTAGVATSAEVSTGAEEAAPARSKKGWETGVSGYFRAPLAIGLSPRPGPDDLDGPSSLQMSYGPNRTVDASYYSFAYTRLQEQDWAEFFVHAKKEHVEAAVGMMGYWYQAAGFRNSDAAWAPATAYVTLDTDFAGNGKANRPNIALTGGAWWPKFGVFDKYDTYTLGRFRQIGEQLRLAIPVNSDLSVTLVQGFGSGRDGSFNILAPAPYQATVGLDLLHYENVTVAYKDNLSVGLHFNTEWTRDPNLTPQTVPGKAYSDATEAHVRTIGGEVNAHAPYAGSLWVSPSYIDVRNGWALAESGIEVMHALGGDGLAANYLAWNNNPPTSTGSGTMLNLGFLYENTLSNISGKEPGTAKPEVTLNVFGLLMDASLDLPEGTTLTQDSRSTGSGSWFDTTRSTTIWTTPGTYSPPSRRD
jgi:hypothetical protein